MNSIILDSFDLPGPMAEYVSFAVLLGLAGLVVWRLFLAYLVVVDAERLFKANRLFLRSSLAWGIGTLALGVLAALTYWLLHYSILVAKPNGGDSRASVD